MALSWNEIKNRAIHFSKELEDESDKNKSSVQLLDKAVDRCYTSKRFKSDKERMEFLFGFYEGYINETN
ncbi:MAG: hypothetical protein Q9M36_07605 [Sulfurovum sp.]|nr:hypothetical protein [Sulfurovum sp.]